MDFLRNQVLRFIAESPSKVNFARLKRHVNDTHQTSTKALKRVVAGLIEDRTLCYTDHYGRSFIEFSYDRPQVISDHVVIKPPWCSWCSSPNQRVVSLKRGVAFGGGEHPSTRLAIQLIDRVLQLSFFRGKESSLRAIDIGTGSGVLAIVAAKMGVGTICGVDTDPCAIFEARENIRLNHVEDRVCLLDKPLETMDGFYDLVFANLRAPTLFGVRGLLENLVATEGALVFSGLKSEETRSITDFYKKSGYHLLTERVEIGWGAICLVRGALLAAMAPSI